LISSFSFPTATALCLPVLSAGFELQDFSGTQTQVFRYQNRENMSFSEKHEFLHVSLDTLVLLFYYPFVRWKEGKFLTDPEEQAMEEFDNTLQ
jgi:hypothetical protein